MKRTPLKRKTPLKRTGSLSPVSKKRAKTNRQRAKFVKEELGNRRWCEAHILDAANSVAICRMCHRWVHDNVAEAKKIGLIKSAPPYRPFP